MVCTSEGDEDRDFGFGDCGFVFVEWGYFGACYYGVGMEVVFLATGYWYSSLEVRLMG